MENTEYGYTRKEQLNTVNDAIHAILVTGQSYKIGSRSLTRADLALLRTMKKELEAELATETETGLFGDTYVGVFDGR